MLERCLHAFEDVAALYSRLTKGCMQILPDCCSMLAEPDCLYNHEWHCHGTCSDPSQNDFFAGTIALHERYNIAVRRLSPYLPALNYNWVSHVQLDCLTC